MPIEFELDNEPTEIPSEDDIVYQIGEKNFEEHSDAKKYLDRVQKKELIQQTNSVFTDVFGERAKENLLAKMSEDPNSEFEDLIEEVIDRSDKDLTSATPRILIGEVLTILGKQFQKNSPLIDPDVEGSFETMAESNVRREEI